MDSSSDFVVAFQTAISDAVNETEVRDRFSTELARFYGLQLRMERGRSDAYLNRVVLEFKGKGNFHASCGSADFAEAFGQLTGKYIPNKAAEDHLATSEYIAVAVDGLHYALVSLDDQGTGKHTDLIPIDADGVVPLLEALIADEARAFTLENIVTDFGAGSGTARTILQVLAAHLADCTDPESGVQKARMLYEEWQKLFAQTISLGRIGRDRIDAYLASVGMDVKGDYTKALFVLHTYNALLFKLIAAEVVTQARYAEHAGFAAVAAGLPADQMRSVLVSRIENAELFVAHGIENFIEGTFFSWYSEGDCTAVMEAVRGMLARLGLYMFSKADVRQVRDVVKAVYQNLVPEALRKNIGEFYTPEWLVDFVLDEVGYTGPGVLDKSLLDPCCGSGNFLIHAIARYRQAAEKAAMGAEEVLGGVLGSVVGFDLNPLAVIAARLNYLLWVADLLPGSGSLEIPVYMADAVYAPVQTTDRGELVREYRIGTVLHDIQIVLPEALIMDKPLFGAVLSTMQRDIESHQKVGAFVEHLRKDTSVASGLAEHPRWIGFIEDMYARVMDMEERKWNRIWCRVVRNYFASIAVGQVDIIAGNPPWVRWSELPEAYRDRIKPTCEEYRIFSDTRYFGGNELDISGMIAYTVTDRWLKPNGKLGFVITQTHFQNPSSQGFRRFELPDGSPLGVGDVHDFERVKPFRGPTNKPAVLTWERGEVTHYPVNYHLWRRKERKSIPEEITLAAALERLERDTRVAVPLPPDNRWSIIDPQHLPLVAKLKGGSSAWQGRKGITTDLNGAYFVELLGPGVAPGTVKVRTRPGAGSKGVPRTDRDIEADLIFPLLKGAGQVRPFEYRAIDAYAVVPNACITRGGTVPEEEFKAASPWAWRYFRRINEVKGSEGRGLLEDRSTYRTRMQGMPFYCVYNVGKYTFQPYKVVWAEMGGTIYAAVVGPQELPFALGTKAVVPDHKIYFVGCDGEDEAHFLCALVNSEPVRVFIDSYTAKLQVGTLFRHINLPGFGGSSLHRKLADLSREAHLSGITAHLQKKLDKLAWKLIATL